jgi:hypothetical protein
MPLDAKRSASEMNGTDMDLETKLPDDPPAWMQGMMASLTSTLNQSLVTEITKSIEPLQANVTKLHENVANLEQRMSALEVKPAAASSSAPASQGFSGANTMQWNKLNPYQKAFSAGFSGFGSSSSAAPPQFQQNAPPQFQQRPVGAPVEPGENFQIVLGGFPMNTPTKMIIETTKEVLAKIMSMSLVNFETPPAASQSLVLRMKMLTE